jgi:hypothetical protein
MLKKYQSKSSISLSVLMNTGKSVHVSFDSLTGGGSIFYTDDEELQEALAKHHKYGRLFKEVELVKPVAEPVVKQKPVVKEEDVEDVEDIDEVDDTEDEVDETEYETTEENAEDEATEEEATEENAEEVQEQEAPVATGKQIHVTNLEDAKNYLADNLGVSRTKLRSKKAILEVAEANGIVFVGI